MKEIKIVSKYDNEKVLLSGKYESIKDCLEKNRCAYLSLADLSSAYLSHAYLSSANLSCANLSGADLSSANLSRADLSSANLSLADLSHAYLSSAKNYLSSHDFFQEIIKRQSVKTFTSSEWVTIGQIIVHRLCWETIKNKHKKPAMRVFKKLSKVGFKEWEEHYKEIK